MEQLVTPYGLPGIGMTFEQVFQLAAAVHTKNTKRIDRLRIDASHMTFFRRGRLQYATCWERGAKREKLRAVLNQPCLTIRLCSTIASSLLSTVAVVPDSVSREPAPLIRIADLVLVFFFAERKINPLIVLMRRKKCIMITHNRNFRVLDALPME